MKIESRQNPKIKYVRRLQTSKRFRSQENAFAVEGTRWLVESVRSQAEIRLVLCTDAWITSANREDQLGDLPVEVIEISSELMAAISALETSEGILAVLSKPDKQIPKDPMMLLIADGISDPGNLGAMVRTAAAAGADGVILAPGCVDAYNPKVVRGGMGAHLHIPLERLAWPDIAAMTAHLMNWVADKGDHTNFGQVDWSVPSSLIIGSEAFGPSDIARGMFEGRVSIPMNQEVESLNAAVATGIILFEASRQRSAEGVRK
jgi:TrmH family RNA methyltransferase